MIKFKAIGAMIKRNAFWCQDKKLVHNGIHERTCRKVKMETSFTTCKPIHKLSDLCTNEKVQTVDDRNELLLCSKGDAWGSFFVCLNNQM